ncbi:MAG: glycosyltransferase [Thalassolituus sp.]
MGGIVPKPPEPRPEAEIMAGWEGEAEKPAVSICCITYNHEKFIKDALNSFLCQVTHFPFEILIHDDASNDLTPEIIEEYASRYPRIIKPVLQKDNQFSKGISPNFSFNFPRAKGDYIALCEGDDFWISEDKLRKQWSELEREPDCVMCFHDAKKIDDDNRFISDMKPGRSKFLTRFELAKAPFTPTLTRMFRNVGFPWRNETGLPAAMDVCLAAYLSQFGGAVYLGNDVVSAYRVHVGGAWSLKSKYQKIRLTVDSRLYIAEHFRSDRNDDLSGKASLYHMGSAVDEIYSGMPFLAVLNSFLKYVFFRAFWIPVKKVLWKILTLKKRWMLRKCDE